VASFRTTPRLRHVNHATRLMKGVRPSCRRRACLADRGLMPKRPVPLPRRTSRRQVSQFEMADVVVVTGNALQAPQISTISPRRPRAASPWCWSAPRPRRRLKFIPTSDYLHIARWRSTDRIMAHPTIARHGLRSHAAVRDAKNCAAADFPIPAYDRHSRSELPDADLAVSSGCPISWRVLATSANLYGRQPRFNTGGARSPPSAMPCAGRRAIRRWSISLRPFHRQSQGQGHAAAPAPCIKDPRLPRQFAC